MPEQLGLSSRAIIGRFFETLAAVLGGSWMTALSMPITSNQESETYAWLGQAPAMDQWKGSRRVKELLKIAAYTLKNIIYDGTLALDIDDLRRDKTGQILIRVDELAARTAQHWEKLGSNLLLANGLCYDGQSFFDTDHSEGDSGSQKNLLTASEVPDLNVGSATAPTPYEMAKAIIGVISWFYTLLDDQAEPINGDAKSFLVMVPVKLWAPAVAGVTNPILNTGTGSADNPLIALSRNQQLNINVVPNPRLSTWTDAFAVFRTDGRAKPLIAQEEYAPRVTALAEGSEEEKKNRRHLYIVEASRTAGYGLWQHAMKATLS